MVWNDNEKKKWDYVKREIEDIIYEEKRKNTFIK